MKMGCAAVNVSTFRVQPWALWIWFPYWVLTIGGSVIRPTFMSSFKVNSFNMLIFCFFVVMVALTRPASVFTIREWRSCDTVIWAFPSDDDFNKDPRTIWQGLLYSAPCGLIYVCEKAPLVSQTLNGALALIIANLWPLLVITDAAAESYPRPAQIYIYVRMNSC